MAPGGPTEAVDVSLQAKTYLGLGLALLAVFEYWTAMRVAAVRGERPPRPRVLMIMHRTGGYVFLVYALGLAWVGFDMLRRFSAIGGYDFGPREFTHAVLAIWLMLLLALKISFVRYFNKYKTYVPLLGVAVVLLALAVWLVAGWMHLAMMGGAKVAL